MQFQGSYIRWNKDMYISGGDLEQTKMIPSIHLTDRCFYIPISIINRETLFRGVLDSLAHFEIPLKKSGE